MQPPKDEKYVVLKRADWDRWMGDETWAREGQPVPIEDAVVIRRQDVFAPPALDAYANAIQIANTIASKDPNRSDLARRTMERLQGIADYFHAQAVAAWDADRKLPD